MTNWNRKMKTREMPWIGDMRSKQFLFFNDPAFFSSCTTHSEMVYISSQSDMRRNSYYCSMTIHACTWSTSYDDIVGLNCICKWHHKKNLLPCLMTAFFFFYVHLTMTVWISFEVDNKMTLRNYPAKELQR